MMLDMTLILEIAVGVVTGYGIIKWHEGYQKRRTYRLWRERELKRVGSEWDAACAHFKRLDELHKGWAAAGYRTKTKEQWDALETKMAEQVTKVSRRAGLYYRLQVGSQPMPGQPTDYDLKAAEERDDSDAEAMRGDYEYRRFEAEARAEREERMAELQASYVELKAYNASLGKPYDKTFEEYVEWLRT